MAEKNFDLVIIGTGPGGYVAAIRASQLGMKVATVEDDNLGGVCLNWGCIPTKTLIRDAEVFSLFKHAGDFGFTYENLQFDFSKVIKRSRRVSQRLSKGVNFLFKKNNITPFFGRGRLVSSNTVEVTDTQGSITEKLTASKIIIATGARPRTIPGVDIDGKKVISSKEAMLLEIPPASMIVMGAGPIGLEFAYIYNTFGTKVTVIEMMPHILPYSDKDVTDILEKNLSRQGINIMTGTRVESVDSSSSPVKVTVTGSDNNKQTVEADIALMAIGVQPKTENVGLEDTGVQTEKGFIIAKEFGQTSVESLYAIGDVVGGPLLAHKASAEGIATVEHIAGMERKPVDYSKIPACTYCNPQVANIGLTEEEAINSGRNIKVGTFPFRANGKSLAINESEGLVKLIFDTELGELIGAHMVGAEVTELINELSLACALGATDADIHNTVHAHPTISETIMEAAANAFGHAIHI